jgi:hypothetical protein
MILISTPPTDSMMLSACTESITLSAGGAKQQSTKSCSRKCGNNGSGVGNSGGGDRFDIGSGKDDCSDNSNGNGDGNGDSGDGYSGDNDSKNNSGSGDSNSGGKNNNQLKAAAEKAATAVNAALVSTLLAS